MRLYVLALAIAGLSGCKSNPYCLNCEGEADLLPGPALDFSELPDLSPADLTQVDLVIIDDGGPCAPTNGGVEKCDGIDNDCNGVKDDVTPDKLVDPNNCGMCGMVCNFNAIHMFATCVGGGDAGAPRCVPTTCMPGFNDLNMLAADGCEYGCTPTTPATETCDGRDNDCNGLVDDPFTLPPPAGYDNMNRPLYNKDTAHCGTCGNFCNLPGAVAACKLEAGTGRGVCGVDHCINNGTDTYRHNPAAGNRDTTGCEVHCPFASTTVTTGSQDCDSVMCTFPPELCNSLDDDCDFTVDDNPTDVGGQCGDKCPGGQVANCVGRCTAGNLVCMNGVRLCMGGQGPVAETCNALDDDCNGITDDGFGFPNYTSNPAHCGGCNMACSLANAVNGCHADAAIDPSGRGVCFVVACNQNATAGFAYVPNPGTCGGTSPRRDGPGGIGCNYACPVWPKAAESCDGRDNNCNGVTDEAVSACAPDGLTPPALTCASAGVCMGQTIPVVCQGGSGWRCNYSSVPNIELDGNGNLRPTETRCNNLDGNCNGITDLDGFPTKNAACTAGQGICLRNGNNICNMAGTGVTCNVTANNGLAKNEECNGLDDDCDGQTDERANGPTFNGYRDPMVQVGSVYVYQYEASRPDATGASPGSKSSRACSTAGVRPWNNVTQTQAAAACAAILDSAGMPMRLCTAAEWQTACEGPGGAPAANTNKYSYSSTPLVYTAGVCNDDSAPGAPAVWNTGSGPGVGGKMCFTDWAAAGRLHDMSGNLYEWTSTCFMSSGNTYCNARGGSFTSFSDGTFPDGTSCEFSFFSPPPGFANQDVGFRCCSANAP